MTSASARFAAKNSSSRENSASAFTPKIPPYFLSFASLTSHSAGYLEPVFLIRHDPPVSLRPARTAADDRNTEFFYFHIIPCLCGFPAILFFLFSVRSLPRTRPTHRRAEKALPYLPAFNASPLPCKRGYFAKTKRSAFPSYCPYLPRGLTRFPDKKRAIDDKEAFREVKNPLRGAIFPIGGCPATTRPPLFCKRRR